MIANREPIFERTEIRNWGIRTEFKQVISRLHYANPVGMRCSTLPKGRHPDFQQNNSRHFLCLKPTIISIHILNSSGWKRKRWQIHLLRFVKKGQTNYFLKQNWKYFSFTKLLQHLQNYPLLILFNFDAINFCDFNWNDLIGI